MNENTDYEPERRRWNILSFSNDVLSVVVAPVRLILQRDGHQEALRENEVQRGEEEATVGSRGGGLFIERPAAERRDSRPHSG